MDKVILDKSGCVLVNKDTKKVCLIKRKDGLGWEFPKGHVENGEDLEKCAIRETEEETMHTCSIVKELFVNIYQTSNDGRFKGQEIEVHNHLFLAVDGGITNNFVKDEDKEVSDWFDVDEVANKFYYENLKESWAEVVAQVRAYLK